ncbi:hypothetical protein EV426DRAFT_234998 [Tirmania nivea]|nr:hypothetical protein EV426DRAFT_234998 [Tirmania nivea]
MHHSLTHLTLISTSQSPILFLRLSLLHKPSQLSTELPYNRPRPPIRFLEPSPVRLKLRKHISSVFFKLGRVTGGGSASFTEKRGCGWPVGVFSFRFSFRFRFSFCCGCRGLHFHVSLFGKGGGSNRYLLLHSYRGFPFNIHPNTNIVNDICRIQIRRCRYCRPRGSGINRIRPPDGINRKILHLHLTLLCLLNPLQTSRVCQQCPRKKSLKT